MLFLETEKIWNRQQPTTLYGFLMFFKITSIQFYQLCTVHIQIGGFFFRVCMRCSVTKGRFHIEKYSSTWVRSRGALHPIKFFRILKRQQSKCLLNSILQAKSKVAIFTFVKVSIELKGAFLTVKRMCTSNCFIFLFYWLAPLASLILTSFSYFPIFSRVAFLV